MSKLMSASSFLKGFPVISGRSFLTCTTRIRPPINNTSGNQINKVFQKCTTYGQRICKSHFQVTRQASWLIKHKTTPQVLTISLGSSLGIGVVGLSRIWSKRAECERNPNKIGRLVGLRDNAKCPDPDFKWRELFKLLLPEIWYLLGAVITALAVALVNIQVPLMLGDVVNVVSKYTHETAGNFLEDMKGPATKLITIYGIQSVLTFVYITCLSNAGERMAARLRKELFQNIISQDISFFDGHKTGEIINRLTADIQDFKSAFKLCISQGLRSTTQVIGCAGSLLIISPKLTSLLFVVVPSIILVGTGIGSLLRGLSRKAQAQFAKATAVADEAVGNVRTVRAFAMESKEMELYNNEVDQSARMSITLGLGIGAFQGLSNLALNGIVLGTLYIGGSLLADGSLQAGDLMSFLVATQTVQRSLAQMSLLFGQAVRGFSAGARVFEYMKIQPSIPLTGGAKVPYHTFHGHVEFKDVTFSYPTRQGQVVLKNFNLNLPAGRMVALCGASGGGKSTIAALLERFYDVESGCIKVDGHDIQGLDPSWLRGRAIGYINQEPILFATSVRENIRYGKPDATDQEVEEAAKMANAHKFISGFPEGYNTILGERGVTVSGGQKQRIAIARALIKNPSILILDEATSALDAESERVVQAALDNAIKGRTVLVIAHRLSTIRNADVIAVIANGTIAEMGTHSELKKKGGLYWNLIRQQESQESRSSGGQG